jgi:hypothetical protein
VRDRVLSLFEPKGLIGPMFFDRLPKRLREAYVTKLNEALAEATNGVVPQLVRLECHDVSSEPKTPQDRYRAIIKTGPREVSLPLMSLSQGYQAAIAWVADLVGQVIWEASLVDIDETGVPLDEMEGIVLIDEIDLHLHPQWQVGFIDAIGKTFPSIQFIVTTHSPILLTGLAADEIVRLQIDDEGCVKRLPMQAVPKLMTGSELYDTYFGLEELYPTELAHAAWRYGVIAANPHRSDAEEAERKRLAEQLRSEGIEPGPSMHRSGIQ